MTRSKLVNLKGLEDHSGIPARSLRTMYQAKKIPYIKAGYRTVLFDPDKVMTALNKFEIHAATSK